MITLYFVSDTVPYVCLIFSPLCSYILFDNLFFFKHILNVSEFRKVRDQVLYPSKQKRCTISILILYFYKDETNMA